MQMFVVRTREMEDYKCLFHKLWQKKYIYLCWNIQKSIYILCWNFFQHKNSVSKAIVIIVTLKQQASAL